MTRAQFKKYWSSLPQKKKTELQDIVPLDLLSNPVDGISIDKLYEVPIMIEEKSDNNNHTILDRVGKEDIADMKTKLQNFDRESIIAKMLADNKLFYEKTLPLISNEIDILKSRETITKIMIEGMINNSLKVWQKSEEDEIKKMLADNTKKIEELTNKNIDSLNEDMKNAFNDAKKDLESQSKIIRQIVDEIKKMKQVKPQQKEQIKEEVKVEEKTQVKELPTPKKEKPTPNVECPTCHYKWFSTKPNHPKIKCSACKRDFKNPLYVPREEVKSNGLV